MKHITFLLALLSALAASACAGGGGSWFETVNAPPPPDTGPGCYDNKGRLVSTILTPRECEFAAWTWKH